MLSNSYLDGLKLLLELLLRKSPKRTLAKFINLLISQNKRHSQIGRIILQTEYDCVYFSFVFYITNIFAEFFVLFFNYQKQCLGFILMNHPVTESSIKSFSSYCPLLWREERELEILCLRAYCGHDKLKNKWSTNFDLVCGCIKV